MSDKTVFKWDPFGDNEGLPLGHIADKKGHVEVIFELGLPIKEAYEYWINFKGVKSVLEGLENNLCENSKSSIFFVKKWMEKPFPIKYVSSFTKEELEELDTFDLSLTLPFGNQKVIDILTDICPNDFEVFPIELETKTGISNKYFLINITNQIKGALDRSVCRYDVTFGKKDGDKDSLTSFKTMVLNPNCMGSAKLGRLYEDGNCMMVHQDVMAAFHKNKIEGMSYLSLEDRINSRYRSNYLPDGKTLKY